jgi:ribosomal protein L37AE/L43A
MRNFTPNIQFKSILERYGKESAYTFYTKTNYWLNLSNKRFAEDKWKCVKCSAKPTLQNPDIKLQAFHLNYNRYPWREQLKDLTTYCNKCHKEETEKVKQKINEERGRKLKHSGPKKPRLNLLKKYNELF